MPVWGFFSSLKICKIALPSLNNYFKRRVEKCVISRLVSKQSNGSVLCVEWPAVLVLLVWDLEQLLCLSFPDNLPNSMEKRRHRLCGFLFFWGWWCRIEIIHVSLQWNEFPNHNTAR